MQIYTRTGDKGRTRLVGGQEVSKDDPRVEAYGTVDELNSLTGYVAASADEWPELQEELEEIQQDLFDVGSDLATPAGKRPYKVTKEMVTWLEGRIDVYSPQVPEVTSFILPGGSQLAALLHYARTVARRAERRTVSFMNQTDNNPYALKYLNRLSDYFFAVARLANKRAGREDVLYKNSDRVFHPEITKEDLPEDD